MRIIISYDCLSNVSMCQLVEFLFVLKLSFGIEYKYLLGYSTSFDVEFITLDSLLHHSMFSIGQLIYVHRNVLSVYI